MNLTAIGIITFKGFHLWVVSAEKFHNPPQHQCQEKTHGTRYGPADIAVFVIRLKPLLFTTVLVFFSTDKRDDDAKDTDHFLMVFLGLGCVVGIALMILQWLVIGHFCLFCMVNHGIVLALAIVTVVSFWSSFSWLSAYQGAKLWAVMFLLCFLVPILGYKLMDQSHFQTFLGIETPQRVVAIIDGQKIALSDVDRDIQITLAELEWRKYEERLEELNEQLIEMEAGGLKSRVRQLIQENVLSNMRITQDDYNAYYDQLKPVHSTLSEQAFRKKVQETLNEDKFKAQLSIYIQQLSGTTG